MRLLVLVVVLLLAACTSDPADPPGVDAPPDGMRWQGMNGVVVAVPDSWATSTDPCRWPDVDSVRLLTRSALATRCPNFGPRNRDASVLTILPAASGVRVGYQGPRRPGFVASVRDSTTALPDGWTTVPAILFGASDDTALKRLETAGLRGSVPDVNWPHYVTGTAPAPGTPVQLGSEVELEIGDG